MQKHYSSFVFAIPHFFKVLLFGRLITRANKMSYLSGFCSVHGGTSVHLAIFCIKKKKKEFSFKICYKIDESKTWKASMTKWN